MDTMSDPRKQRESWISISRNLKPRRGKVDLPNHGNSNRPRCIADRQTEIRIIRSLVLAFLHMMYDLCQTGQHVIRE